jgi:hypothetical protein
VLGSALLPHAYANPWIVPLGQRFDLGCEPTGGSGVYTGFAWKGSFGFESGVQNPGPVTPDRPGPHQYTVTVTDGSGLEADATVTVLVAQPLPSISVSRGGIRYQVTSASNMAQPRDAFKVVMRGLDVGPGDRVSMNFNGVAVGDLASGDGLTLDHKLRARGQLGTEPYVFHDVRIRYKAKRRRLSFVARRGNTARAAGSAVVMASSGVSPSVPVVLIIDRAPADGVPDVAAMAMVPFKVKVRTRGQGVSTESGRAARRR